VFAFLISLFSATSPSHIILALLGANVLSILFWKNVTFYSSFRARHPVSRPYKVKGKSISVFSWNGTREDERFWTEYQCVLVNKQKLLNCFTSAAAVTRYGMMAHKRRRHWRRAGNNRFTSRPRWSNGYVRDIVPKIHGFRPDQGRLTFTGYKNS
jgi:hypothetical protein